MVMVLGCIFSCMLLLNLCICKVAYLEWLLLNIFQFSIIPFYIPVWFGQGSLSNQIKSNQGTVARAVLLLNEIQRYVPVGIFCLFTLVLGS